ncbi:hypothetical protein [uncultured Megasphaera sp.]|jgi:hypothetical protein|uniref:hypothetical protein n=1 Tax=uncultured Megasphaera sp. TaxID=165188 RepID=UPI00266DA903|nr:hypothetical protein [uncultured Megasphaera sp.]
MVGYPKNLNTRADYEFVRANFSKEDFRQDFQNLLDTMGDWFNVGKLSSGEQGKTDKTHKVVKDESGDSYQYEFKVNPNCRMFQLGYTEEYVKKILA